MWPVPEQSELPLFTSDYLVAISNGETEWTCDCPTGVCVCDEPVIFRPTGP